MNTPTIVGRTDRGTGGRGVDDGLRLLGRHAPLGRAEMEADQVGARLDGRGRSSRVTDSADLHLDHAVSSLMRSSGFSALMSASPTRIALAPASYTRRASSASLIPPSATTTTVAGISLRSR